MWAWRGWDRNLYTDLWAHPRNFQAGVLRVKQSSSKGGRGGMQTKKVATTQTRTQPAHGAHVQTGREGG